MSTAQLMVPVLPLLQYVPAPAEQNGSTTQVHAALGAAPVQAWWAAQVTAPVVG